MRLARFELRRFLRGRLTAAALVVLAIIPLLYGALYLVAFWDPYGKLDRIPAALVDQDRPATATDGSTLDAGKDLTTELLDRHVFAWHTTSQAEAERGLADGRYQMIFRIPANFSGYLAGNSDPAQSPEQGRLEVTDNDANNYLSGLLSRGAFTEIRAAAQGSIAARYFDKMLIGFAQIKSQTGQAADAAGQLSSGADQAGSAANRLATGADSAKSGADQLSGGLGSATSAAGTLADGLTTLDAGAGQLADAAAQAAAGGNLLRGKVDTAADQIEPVLRANAQQIAQAATAIANGADLIANNIALLPQLADQAVGRATTVSTELDALVKAHPELADDPAVKAARAAASAALSVAQQVRAKLAATGVDQLRQQLVAVAATARQVAAQAPGLADKVAAARGQVDQLSDGLNRLSAGATLLHQNTGTAKNGAVQLEGGLYRLSSGARQLDGGLGTLDSGTHQLASGLSSLQSGASQLASGLADGAARIPGYDTNDAASRADVLGDPVALNRQVHNPASTYGVGFAPYFVGLALWVGAMITYLLLRPVNVRHLVSGARPTRVALASWLPVVAIGTAQVVLLVLVLRFGLGIRPVHPVAAAGYLLLTTVTFSALMQWLGVAFGPAGRLGALALLMLQLTSSGGTYPLETSPAFFRAIHPFLPMSYVVDGLRHLIDGGSTGTVVTGALVLAGFAGAGFAATSLAVRRVRRLTPGRLHPELAL